MQRNPRSTPQAGLFKQYSPSIAANKHCIIPNSFSFPVNMRFVKLSSGMASVKNAKNDTSSITPLFCVNKSKNFESVKIHKQFPASVFIKAQHTRIFNVKKAVFRLPFIIALKSPFQSNELQMQPPMLQHTGIAQCLLPILLPALF